MVQLDYHLLQNLETCSDTHYGISISLSILEAVAVQMLSGGILLLLVGI